MIPYLDEALVRRVLTPAITRDLMQRTLEAAARGSASNPPRAVLALDGWVLAAMPAAVDLGDLRGLGAKLVTVFPRNAERGIATHQALILLCDPDDGRPMTLVAGETITERRTAAVSVVATQRLAARPVGTYAILGAGVQGHAHLEAFLDAGMLRALRTWSPTTARAEALARAARECGVAAIAVASAAECVNGADVIVTATGSGEPLFDASAAVYGAHINAVGACVASRRELPAELVGESTIYADSYAGAEHEAGDLILAARDLGRAIVPEAELGAMLVDPKRKSTLARFTLFKSLGLGIEDIACAAYVNTKQTLAPESVKGPKT